MLRTLALVVLIACGPKSAPSAGPPAPPPTSAYGPSCALALAAVCDDGWVDGCSRQRANGELLTRVHVCVPASETDGPPCAQDLARQCPTGQIDACFLEASDVHICVQDPR